MNENFCLWWRLFRKYMPAIFTIQKVRKENNRQDMSSKLLFFISANWVASQSNWFRALYDERKIEGKSIIRVFWSIRSLCVKVAMFYNSTPIHTISQSFIMYNIPKSLIFDNITFSKELLPTISNEHIMRNGC